MTLTAERSANSIRSVDFAAARRAMIDSQLRTSGVTDAAIVEAMGRVAREAFVPDAVRNLAYIDRAIPLGDGHALPAPLFHGLLLREAALRTDDRVLIVTGGSDYLPALVEAMGAPSDRLAADDVADAGPGDYSLILVDGAVEVVSPALVAQLSEGGRIVTGLVERGVTRLAIGRKFGGKVTLLPLAEIGIPVLAAFAAPKRWSF